MQENKFELVLPFPPSINRTWRIGNRHLYVNPKVKVFYEQVKAAYIASRAQNFTVGERLDVRVYLHPPTRRSFDLDNRIKQLLDGLERCGAIGNDSQIDSLYIERMEVVKEGMARVVVVEKKLHDCQTSGGSNQKIYVITEA